MRKILLLAGAAALVAVLAPLDADARGGSRSVAARFAPTIPGPHLRFRFNRALVKGLRLPCRMRGSSTAGLRCDP